MGSWVKSNPIAPAFFMSSEIASYELLEPGFIISASAFFAPPTFSDLMNLWTMSF